MNTPDNPLLWLVSVHGLLFLSFTYFAMILIERAAYALFRPGEYDDANAVGSFLNNLWINGTAMVIGAVIPLLTYILIYEHLRIFDLGYVWYAVLAAFVVHESAYYFGHYLGHRTGFFWAWHSPHHSSEELNLTTAARGFTFGDPVANLLGMAGALLGIPPLLYVTVVIFKNFWGMFNHTRLVDKMGPLENWLATPANHRVHHGRNPQYIDKNYGQVTVIWDRIFGTFTPETEAPDFGLVEPMTSNNPLKIWAYGWVWLGRRMKSAPTLRQKLQYLYKPPEWTHTGEIEGCRAALLDPAE